jgi:tetratricopeptide (TPR) repeat protein
MKSVTTNIPLELDDSFEEHVAALYGELEQAIKWERPSILLAIYSSEFVRADAEDALTAELNKLGQTSIHYHVSGKENADIALNLSQQPDVDHTVFFVSGLQWGGGEGGGNAYRALNYRREYFVDYHIRVIFWVTEEEAVALPNLAPDFWAFRHRVIEFFELPAPKRAAEIEDELYWASNEERALRQDTESKIAFREALLKDFDETRETLATRADLLSSLANLYWVKRDYEKSADLWRQTRRLAERLKDARLRVVCYIGLGNIYRTIGWYKRGATAFQRAIELDPSSIPAYTGLGIVYRILGRYDEAIHIYQQAIDRNADEASPYNGLGWVFLVLGRHNEARNAFLRAIELDPKYISAWNGLGKTFASIGRNGEAIAAFRQAIKLDPSFTFSWNSLGGILMDLGNANDAVKAFKEAIRIAPQTASSWNGLGSVYTRIDQREEAIAAFQRAIELEPRAVEAYNGLGFAYACQGRAGEAIASYLKAIEMDAKYALPHYKLGKIYSYVGRDDEAIASFQKAIRLDPGSGSAHISLAASYRKQGKSAKAEPQLAIARQLLEKEKEYNRALYASVCGKTDEALALLGIALNKKQIPAAWACLDPDLGFVRDDPRFLALVGEG